jgi:hypothetical protein
VELALGLRRLNGDLLSVRLLFPNEVSALTLKAFATSVRIKPTDIIDVWRCLEICFAAGVKAAAFSRGATGQDAAIICELFDRQDGLGHAGADRSAAPEQGRRRPAIHPDPCPDGTNAAAKLSSDSSHSACPALARSCRTPVAIT